MQCPIPIEQMNLDPQGRPSVAYVVQYQAEYSPVLVPSISSVQYHAAHSPKTARYLKCPIPGSYQSFPQYRTEPGIILCNCSVYSEQILSNSRMVLTIQCTLYSYHHAVWQCSVQHAVWPSPWSFPTVAEVNIHRCKLFTVQQCTEAKLPITWPTPNHLIPGYRI